ncbi:hypothetical protein UY3_10342 [Chelonia mydas]|uniref:Uncharacterized protein n=1 Tax=Chelonia mydas TaxID=8469 RepID=M7BAC9_CHEMY|nr:hypothetical protein UY3_10342 [Chelonia mydas]
MPEPRVKPESEAGVGARIGGGQEERQGSSTEQEPGGKRSEDRGNPGEEQESGTGFGAGVKTHNPTAPLIVKPDMAVPLPQSLPPGSHGLRQ